jgi:hypothetical protein
MPIPIPEATRPSLDPHTIELCEKTDEPNHAYVAFEKLKVESYQVGTKWQKRQTTGLCIMNVQDQPNQRWIINDNILSRGMKIIGYGKIPHVNDLNKNNQILYKAHDEGGTGSNAYDRLKALCNSFMGQRAEVNKEIEEAVSGYKQELAKAQAKLEALSKTAKPKKGSKSDENQDGQEGGVAAG